MKICKLAKLLGLRFKSCTDTSVSFSRPDNPERVVIILLDGRFKLSVDSSEHKSITGLISHYRGIIK